jgi:hypothetical protein
LHCRDSKNDRARENCVPRKEVIGITFSGETRTLAEFVGTGWSLMDSHWSLHLQKKSGDDGHLFELMGSRKVFISSGSSLPHHSRNFRILQNRVMAEWLFR